MSKLLPYPGRYESHENWMRRCDEWVASRRSSNRRGLSGKPDHHGYKNVEKGEVFELPDGRRVEIARYGYGSQYSQLTEKFADANGFGFHGFRLGRGMTARYDGVAYIDDSKNKIRDEVYSDDDH